MSDIVSFTTLYWDFYSTVSHIYCVHHDFSFLFISCRWWLPPPLSRQHEIKHFFFWLFTNVIYGCGCSRRSSFFRRHHDACSWPPPKKKKKRRRKKATTRPPIFPVMVSFTAVPFDSQKSCCSQLFLSLEDVSFMACHFLLLQISCSSATQSPYSSGSWTKTCPSDVTTAGCSCWP